MQQQTLHNSSLNHHKNINFIAPKYLIDGVDHLLRLKKVSRTSILLKFLENFLRYELKQMKSDKENLQSLNIDPKPYIQSDSLDLPMPQSNNFEDEIMNERFWEERLK